MSDDTIQVLGEAGLPSARGSSETSGAAFRWARTSAAQCPKSAKEDHQVMR